MVAALCGTDDAVSLWFCSTTIRGRQALLSSHLLGPLQTVPGAEVWSLFVLLRLIGGPVDVGRDCAYVVDTIGEAAARRSGFFKPRSACCSLETGLDADR